MIIVVKYTLRKYSFLRILQLIELSKLNLNGQTIDLGGNPVSNNLASQINLKGKLWFADKFQTHESTIKLDLETDKSLNTKYSNVTIINVLEHLKNYKNAINLCYEILENDGLIIGSTPFMYKVHYSPNDYYRYTAQLIVEELESSGFREVKIKPLGLGPLTNFYSIISDYIFSIFPLLNILVLIPFIIIDKLFSLINQNFVKHYPLGYYFTAKKIN